MAVVYQHKRLDTNDIFYIGIELDSDKKKAIGKRSRRKEGRNQIWKRIIHKTDYEIKLLFTDVSNKEAIEIEKYLIKYYGRINLKTGTLSNMTDGGEGCVGQVFTQEHRNKISNFRKGKLLSDETKLKISIATKGKIESTETLLKKSNRMKGNTIWLGKKHTEETRLKMSKSAMGLKSKKVICTKTLKIWNNTKECAEENGMSFSTLKKYLSGDRKNKSTYVYLEKYQTNE